MIEGLQAKAAADAECVNIHEIQTTVNTHFAQLNREMGEIGTCKKMVNLGCLNPQWQHLAVVYSKEATAASKDMINKEYKLLKHLEAQDYPVVKVWGEAFTVQTTATHERLGMILTYLPGVFIEAKTAKPLNLLITSALLGLQARSQEAWLVFQHSTLLKQIATALAKPEHFEQFHIRAASLARAFQTLRQKLMLQQEKIHDLQLIISNDGTLTIIDPLDILTLSDGNYLSLLEKQKLQDASFVSFVQNTDSWLFNAQQFCQQLLRCDSCAEVLEYCSLNEQKPLIFSSALDPAGKSRLNQLKRPLLSSPPIPKAASSKQKI